MPMDNLNSGGGTTGFCDISTSDQIGTLSNILNRLQAVEAALSVLLGTNLEAAQLSDISNDLGWIYNVTYLGQEGWTQTPSGTLIPPDGWTGLSGIIDGISGITIGGVYGATEHRYDNTGETISNGNTNYITLDASLSAGNTAALNAASIIDITTSFGNPVWEIQQDGIYDMFLYVNGYAPGGTGVMDIYLNKESGGFAGISGQSCQILSGGGVSGCLFARRAFTSGVLIGVQVYNNTGASLGISYAEMMITKVN